MATEELAGTKRLALLGVLTALCVVLRIFKIIPVPNVQPVTTIIMLTYTLKDNKKTFLLAKVFLLSFSV